MSSRRRIRIPAPKLDCSEGVWRLSAQIEGSEIFFESRNRLSPRCEALVCACLLSAMSLRADLEVEGPLDPTFRRNIDRVRLLAREWWPQLEGGEVFAASGEPQTRGTQVGLFYTGGADSSYSLRKLQSRIQSAIFTEGFDIKLEDRKRLDGAKAWLATTTRICGVDLLVVRTNLRLHPVFRAARWEVAHGAALASVAHALSETFGKVFVAASDVAPPWGSTPELDSAWSSSGLSIENFSSELSRLQRVAEIARWEPLRGRLRVCWENRSDSLNCGVCEKCVRTRLQLYVSGARDGLDAFPPETRPLEALREISSIHGELHEQWRQIAVRLEDRRLRREVERLLAGKPQPRWRRGLRRLKRKLRRLREDSSAA